MIVLLSLVGAVVSQRRYVDRVRSALSRARTSTATGTKRRPGQTRRARMMQRMEARWRRRQEVTAGCAGGRGVDTVHVGAVRRDRRGPARPHPGSWPGQPDDAMAASA